MNKKTLVDFISQNIECEDRTQKFYLQLKLLSLHEYDLLNCYKWIVNQLKHKKPSYTLFNAFYSKHCKDKTFRLDQLKFKEIDLNSLRKSIFPDYKPIIKERNYSCKGTPKQKKNTLKKVIELKSCLQCYLILKKKYEESHYNFSKRKFCDLKCSAKFINGEVRSEKLKAIEERKCEMCNIIFECRKNEKPTRFKKRRFCSQHCRLMFLNAKNIH